MKKCILLVLCLGLMFADFNASLSGYSDNDSYNNEIGANYNILQDNIELGAYASMFASDSTEILKAGISVDLSPEAEYSPFMFANYSRNSSIGSDYYIVGAGAAWLVNASILEYPYRNKLSLAIIKKTGFDDYYLSFRYKFEGHYHKAGLKYTGFLLPDGSTSTATLSYNMNENLSSFIKHDHERVGTQSFISNLIGIEYKI